MKFKTEFWLNDAALEDNPFEISDILRNISKQMTHLKGKYPNFLTEKQDGSISDSNGNIIGNWQIHQYK